MTALARTLAAFVDRYHACDALVAEQADWSCSIRLAPWDCDEVVHLQVECGRVAGFAETAGERVLIVRSDLAVLVDILLLRLDPNEPYLFGELTVEGAEEDFMRLDYIVTRLCAQ